MGVVLLSAFRPPHRNGGCAACRLFHKRVHDGMELSKRKFLRRVKGKAGTLADDDKGIEGDIGMGSYALFCPHIVDIDGRVRWVLSTERHSCEWGIRPKWRPWGFRPVDMDKKTIRGMRRPEVVHLEVLSRIMIPSDLRDAWKCSFDIDVTLPFRYPLTEWVGEGVELKGKLVFRGERFSRRVGPHLQWMKESIWVIGAVKDRAKIGPIAFKGRVTCLTRVGAELLSLNLRWVPDGYEVDKRGRSRAGDDEGNWSQLNTSLRREEERSEEESVGSPSYVAIEEEDNMIRSSPDVNATSRRERKQREDEAKSVSSSTQKGRIVTSKHSEVTEIRSTPQKKGGRSQSEGELERSLFDEETEEADREERRRVDKRRRSVSESSEIEGEGKKGGNKTGRNGKEVGLDEG